MTYVRIGDVRIGIDAGISCRAIKVGLESIGVRPEELDGIFITHEHSDHIKGLSVLTKRYRIPIHAAGDTAEYIECADGCLVRHTPCYTVKIGEVSVTSFTTPHDSVCSVGYIISDGETSIGVATDMGYIPDEIETKLSECTYVVLESNHDPKLLRNGSYPQVLKARIASRSGHLSNADCAACAARLAKAKVRGMILAHLSEENNRPELALIEAKTALERAGVTDLVLKVAAKNEATRLV